MVLIMDSFTKFRGNALLCKHILFLAPPFSFSTWPVTLPLSLESKTQSLSTPMNRRGLSLFSGNTVDWYYKFVFFTGWCVSLHMLTPSCCLSLLQNHKDTFTQETSTWWKGHSNRIWLQTKDDVMMEPDRIWFVEYKWRNWNPARAQEVVSCALATPTNTNTGEWTIHHLSESCESFLATKKFKRIPFISFVWSAMLF